MSLVGAISLTNNTNGVYLGKVNINNLNLSSDQIAYSPNGIDISGLNISTGLQKNSNNLITVGNPNIQLTSNSLYVNDNVSSITSALLSVSQADTIYISSGSYGESVSITDKYNISLINPSCNNGTICEILNGLNILGTSELIRVSNIQVKGSTSLLYGVGRNLFNNVNFTGTVATAHNIVIGQGSTKYMTFTNCSFNQYCNIFVSNTFTDVLYFINCNFGGATITLSNLSPSQVIFNNCAGFVSYPTNCAFFGMNVLTSGASKLNANNVVCSQINGASIPPTITINNQADNRIVSSSGTTNTLDCETNLTYDGTKLGINTINLFPTNAITETLQITDADSSVGSNSVAVGHKAISASSCVSLGYQVGRTGMSGSYNVLIGRSTAIGLTTGNGNVIIGGNAAQVLTTGTNNTFVGVSAGAGQSSQSNNSIFGYSSNCKDTLGVTRANSGVFGDNITEILTGDNEIQIGKSTTTVYTYATGTRSDARDKADIKEEELGLNFIEKLKPKQYKWNYREDYRQIDENGNITELPNDGSKKRNRFHNGFLAQDIQDTMTELNIDFAGLQNGSVNGGTDVYHLAYTEFIAPLVKAVQQLSEKVKILENKIIN